MEGRLRIYLLHSQHGVGNHRLQVSNRSARPPQRAGRRNQQRISTSFLPQSCQEVGG